MQINICPNDRIKVNYSFLRKFEMPIIQNAKYLYDLSHSSTYPTPSFPPAPTNNLANDRKIYASVALPSRVRHLRVNNHFNKWVGKLRGATPSRVRHLHIYHRFLSWEHCCDAFGNAFNLLAKGGTPNIDYLALHLANFLASWGMYRGSSFLLQVDYKVHIPVVRKILNYKHMYGIDWSNLNTITVSNYLTDLFHRNNGLIKFISDYYACVRHNVVFIQGTTPPPATYRFPNYATYTSHVSSILVSKILLGTLGCVPAYDDFFTDGLKSYNPTLVASGLKPITIAFGRRSISELIDHYKSNNVNYDSARISMSTAGGNPYPEMKFLDMGFWI